MNIVFLTLVLVLAIASLHVKKSIGSLIAFGLMMLLLGIYYITLDEKLLGLFQIFVYTGGIAVLMLFGITLIGVEYPRSKGSLFGGVVASLFFGVMVFLFFHFFDPSTIQPSTQVEPKNYFAAHFADTLIIFALIASSLIYGTIKMIQVIKPKRKKDV